MTAPGKFCGEYCPALHRAVLATCELPIAVKFRVVLCSYVKHSAVLYIMVKYRIVIYSNIRCDAVI